MIWKMLKAKQKKTGIKYKFEVRVLWTSKEELEIDASEGTTYWADAMEKETNIIAEEYKSFKEKGKDEDLNNYQYITFLWALEVENYYKLLSGPLFVRNSWGDHPPGRVVEWNGLFN